MKNILLLLLIPVIGFSQTGQQKEIIKRQTNRSALEILSETSKARFYSNKKLARQIAFGRNWPMRIVSDSIFSELIGVDVNSLPIYYTTFNEGAGFTSRANRLYTGGSLGLDVNGELMLAGVWDAGSAMPSHQLFTGRLQLMDDSFGTHYHSAHVAGTIIGSPQFVGGQARGMAYLGNANSYDWNNDVGEVATAAADGLLVSNHSYGLNPDFLADYQFGKYNDDARDFDEIMFNAPYYQFVCAAGNSRGSYNLGKNGYDLLTGHAVSKNSIVVAAVEEVANYTGPASVQMSDFSSWGSTDDGRIKPDISAKGVSTYSATDDSNSSYTSLSGTSMASPSVAGTLLLLQQYYSQLNSNFMKAATLKGLVIHTADEAGTTAGPDYSYGWGLINAEKAADIITKRTLQSYIMENTLIQGSIYSISVNALENEPLIATLTWTDPKGVVGNNVIDNPTPTLVNDLDIRVVNSAGTLMPWKLSVSNPGNPATLGDNVVDNVEKIEIENPSGSYTVNVSHKGNLQNNLQNYSLIISGVSVRDFWVTTEDNVEAICMGGNNAEFAFELFTKSNFNQTVAFSASGLPTGAVANFSPSTLSAAGSFTLTLTGLSSVPVGTYNFTVLAQAGSDIFEMPVTLKILSPIIQEATLLEPANNIANVVVPLTFSWLPDLNAEEYDIQISVEADFSTIFESATVAVNSYVSMGLLNSMTYYWRVRSKNRCAVGSYSPTFNFETECLLPDDIAMVNATTTTATIGWEDNSDGSSWEIEVVPEGTAPSGVGTAVLSNPYTISGLLTSTCYDFYVRSSCSAWAGPFAFCTQADYCGGDHFYDSGGPAGNYEDYENETTVIFPENAGDRVRAIFNSFSLEYCCDYFTVFNGPDVYSPILYSSEQYLAPVNLASTHPSGALTFRFTTDGSVISTGWDATIICEPMPPCPVQPEAIAIVNATTSTATLTWLDLSNAASWEVETVPNGQTPTGSGITVSSTTYQITGLATNTCYDFYVRSVCSNGNSSWTGPFEFCTQADFCGGDHFYDSGGANGNYQNGEYTTTVIYPENSGDRIRAVFNSFELENCCDSFIVYNGPDTSFPVLYASYNWGPPGDIASTHSSGALTFWFASDSSVTYSGWDATITCEPLPPCPNAPAYVSLGSVTTSTAQMSWTELSESTSWEVQVVLEGAGITGDGLVVNSNTYQITGLVPNTCYDFYVRSICSDGNSEWTGPVTFCSQPDYCNGDHFYDSGGPTGNYQNSEYSTTVIYPDDSGDRVRAIFSYLSLENCCDTFTVFNGPNENFPVLYSSYAGNIIGTVASTHSSGALTFRFYTDGSVTASGWDATIICEPMPACPVSPDGLTVFAVTTSSATISWTESSNATSWEVETVLHDATPTGNGVTISSNPYQITGLQTNTCYDFYVRSLCGDGTSSWTGPFTFCTQPNYCAGDHFYDSGGANGNYQNYEYNTTVINPENVGDRVRAVFSYLSLENCCDYFTVFNGPTENFPVLYSSYNGSPIGSVASTHPSGALTFRFQTDGSVTSSGWDATIICEPLPACPNPPADITLVGATTNTATVSWTDLSNATTWEIETVLQGAMASGVGITVDNTVYQIQDLETNTWYDVYVRSICTDGTSAWTGPFAFSTQPDYCNGDHFYDSGGANGNYQDYEDRTSVIFPETAGSYITATFNSFQLESCCDYLMIHNGPNASYPVLYAGTGNNSPGVITSTDMSGALTFVFTSDGSVTYSGWDATIDCGSLSVNPITSLWGLQYHPNPVVDYLKVGTVEQIASYSLYDVHGRLISAQQVNELSFEIDFHRYSSGMYIVKLFGHDGQATQLKVVKE